MREGEVYVVTGPAFVGSTVKSLRGRVLVPTHVWKAVYAPRSGLAGAYLAPNDASGAWRRVGLAELRDVVGLDAFPLLSPAAKAAAGALPEPSPGRKGPGHAEAHAPSGLGGFIKRMLGFHR